VVKVKICGITNLEDARISIKSGCDALGFVFYKKSPRYIAPLEAREIIRQLPKRIIKVGVFVNAKEKLIKNIAKLCRLDILQFHGNESPKFCRRFKGRKVIKAFRIKNRINLPRALQYKTFGFLFDTYVKSKIGGTGKRFNWVSIRRIDIDRQIFLSGGLSARNVGGAVKIVHPDWVDASSSLEKRAGRKDPGKVRQFIKSAKSSN